MGVLKQKWTAEEEAALKAGVDKYGPGKWRAIQKDAKLGPFLTQRSNVDLKDKWRNMCVAPGLALPKSSREERSHGRARSSETSTGEKVPVGESEGRGRVKGKALARASSKAHAEFLVEAILALDEPEGSSLTSVVQWVEENKPVSTTNNIKKLLQSGLKALTEEGKVVKARQNYKLHEDYALSRALKKPRLDADRSRLVVQHGGDGVARVKKDVSKKSRLEEDVAQASLRTVEEAALVAAQAVAEAEEAAAAAELAAREAEAAEAEAAAAEAAAEAAAAAVRPPKKRAAAAGASSSAVAPSMAMQVATPKPVQV